MNQTPKKGSRSKYAHQHRNRLAFLWCALTLVLSLFGVPESGADYLCGTPHLKELYRAHAGAQRMEPPENAPARTAPGAPAVLPIGTERTFFVPDFRSLQQYTVSAVLQGIGNFCYIFVEGTEWNTRVNTGTVQALIRAFDAATPANPQQGIYDTLTQHFGAPPDIDANGKIILLLLNIRDAAGGGGRYTAGFFNPADQNRGVLRNPGFRGFPIRSNEAELLYIDTQPLNPNSERAHNVVAHEFQHLLNWHQDPRESTWVDEGCAEYASFLCGYSLQEHIAAFEAVPDVSLVTWPLDGSNSLPHYGASFLWMLYLHENYGGVETLREIVENRGTSLTGISNALAAQGITESFSDIFVQWKLANYLSDYEAVTLAITPARWHVDYPSGTERGQLHNFSAAYIGFRNAAGVTLGFSGSTAANSSVHAIEFHDTGAVAISEMPLSARNTGSLRIASTAAEVVLVPSLEMEVLDLESPTALYEYSATRGAHITFTSTVIPNPVHPRYWDIIAESAEPLVGLTPAVTLILSQGSTERLYMDAQPLRLVTQAQQDNRLYRFSFLLEPEIAPRDVTYQISLESRTVYTGTLTD